MRDQLFLFAAFDAPLIGYDIGALFHAIYF